MNDILLILFVNIIQLTSWQYAEIVHVEPPEIIWEKD